MRRQPSMLPGASQPLAGVSSFAYQGTNSHVIAGAVGPAVAYEAPRSQLWHQQRFWYQVRLLQLSRDIDNLSPCCPCQRPFS